MTVKTSTEPGSRPSGKENGGCVLATAEDVDEGELSLVASLPVPSSQTVDSVVRDSRDAVVEAEFTLEVISHTAALSRPLPCSGWGYIGFA